VVGAQGKSAGTLFRRQVVLAGYVVDCLLRRKGSWLRWTACSIAVGAVRTAAGMRGAAG
jgi:hypothetical protein